MKEESSSPSTNCNKIGIEAKQYWNRTAIGLEQNYNRIGTRTKTGPEQNCNRTGAELQTKIFDYNITI